MGCEFEPESSIIANNHGLSGVSYTRQWLYSDVPWYVCLECGLERGQCDVPFYFS